MPVEDPAPSTLGLQLDTDMEATVVQDDFGLSDAFSDPNKELWLLRVPLDFPEKNEITWTVIPSKKMAIEATCSEHGIDYRLEDDAELRSAPIYATRSTDASPLPIARRIGIYRQTNASHDKDDRTQGDHKTLQNEDILHSVQAMASPEVEKVGKAKEKKSKKRRQSKG